MVTSTPQTDRTTRYPELRYARFTATLWRVLDASDNKPVGPHYRTKRALLADMERYATQWGCAQPQPVDAVHRAGFTTTTRAAWDRAQSAYHYCLPGIGAETMITHAQYEDIASRLTAFQAWIDTSSLVARTKRGWTRYKPEDVPPTCRVSNEECSSLEVWDFCHDKPARYFAYVHMDTQREGRGLGSLTTWTGEILATITRIGARWRSNFGDTRQMLYATGINGLRYLATSYVSAGDYCRMRVITTSGLDRYLTYIEKRGL